MPHGVHPDRHRDGRAQLGARVAAALAPRGVLKAAGGPGHAAVMAADVLTGNDQNCFNWIKENRDPNAPTGGRGDREGRRRRTAQ